MSCGAAALVAGDPRGADSAAGAAVDAAGLAAGEVARLKQQSPANAARTAAAAAALIAAHGAAAAAVTTGKGTGACAERRPHVAAHGPYLSDWSLMT